jgi:hypothetical protein
MYHVMSRGDQRDDIFLSGVDRHDFIKTLAEACEKAGRQVHAFSRMRNQEAVDEAAIKEISQRPHLGKPKGAKTDLQKWMNGENKTQATLAI